MVWLAQGGVPADHVAQVVGLRTPGRHGGVGGRIPDLVVWRKTQADRVWLPPGDVLLVVEIVSPGSSPPPRPNTTSADRTFPRRGGDGYGPGMSDAIFTHPRLAPVYDAFDGDRDDLDAYLAIADELDAHVVLDLGCGTGNLALLLTRHGRTVVGVDPAEASLDVARAKDGADRVRWIRGDATTLPPLRADLATMTGNVAQVFRTDDDWERTLRGVHAALRPGGHLVFETRRPGRRAWEEWADTAPVTRDVPGVGPVEQRLEVTAVDLPLVSFRYTYRFLTDGVTLTSDSTLRFRDRDEVEASLASTGYRVTDVREAPDRPDREFVFVAHRVDQPLGCNAMGGSAPV
ncbi:class I SAM-dependent methyltransferase [Micromonospora sediminicola]|uniref:class I SAM-dependent methyltransferase n=1 Tax=Micromonospora sediminicola TaxID=946078 RepID=UPI0033AFE07A